ncbi:Protein CTNS-1 a [Aphelenchoides avenae]|nr:Protein CTNS-1 a [Aphelenchus avenae]
MIVPLTFLLATTGLAAANKPSPLKPSAGTSADDRLSIEVHSTVPVTFTYSGKLTGSLQLTLNTSSSLVLNPTELRVDATKKKADVNITGVSVTSLTFVDIHDCKILLDQNRTAECPFNKSDVYVAVTVVHSHVISVLVPIVGWLYFFAWSISFYPQIILNFQRKSVEGLNFDFLVLNIIGFACYTVYNAVQYFDVNVQELYLKAHPRSNSPVLINDLVFAAHALFACIVTGVQCFFYERGNQRVSYICRGWSTVLVLFSIGSLIVSLFDVINYLQFVTYLSYVKMAVTLSKYFPQAILNFRRKSTVGWSIGNVLLDFTGGLMDIIQMVLQASNTDDWSAFIGNKVKFGLGLVSIIFDVVFVIQHYVLYRNSHADDGSHYNHVDTAETSAVTERSSANTATDHSDPIEA